MNSEELAKKIREAIRGEAEAQEYYKKLIRMLKDKKDQEMVEKYILEDERKHYEQFRDILRTYTGEDYEPGNGNADISDHLTRALSEAIMDELEAAEMYREILLASDEKYVRDTFFEAMTDEMEHAIRLNYLYAKYK